MSNTNEQAAYNAAQKFFNENGPQGTTSAFISGWNAAKQHANETERDVGKFVVIDIEQFSTDLRLAIAESDYDFTKIFKEIEYEGETYCDISDDGIDDIVRFTSDLLQMKKEDQNYNRRPSSEHLTDADEPQQEEEKDAEI